MVACHRFHSGLFSSCELRVCWQILASLFSKVSQNFHSHISDATAMWIFFFTLLWNESLHPPSSTKKNVIAAPEHMVEPKKRVVL